MTGKPADPIQAAHEAAEAIGCKVVPLPVKDRTNQEVTGLLVVFDVLSHFVELVRRTKRLEVECLPLCETDHACLVRPLSYNEE